jgi:hypothetical protein
MKGTNMESPEDKYSRVQQMILDEGNTWDLSPNDKAALRHVLGLVNSMADEIADATGQAVGYVWRRHGRLVETIQT